MVFNKEILSNFIKGLVIGIGKIIPGVSGAILAILLGVYDKSLYYLSNFKNNIKEGTKYLLPIGVGVILSIIIFSKIINYTLNNYYLPTLLFFSGLLLGESPSLYNKINKKNYYIIVITFIIILLITISNINNTYILQNNSKDYIILFMSGIIEALGTVVPGLSSSALLMLLGTYNIVISNIGNIININSIRVLLPFIIGLILGLILIIKIINYLLNKYHDISYNIIFGIYFSSVIILIIKSFSKEYTNIEFVIGLILLVLGIFISSIFKEK